jgi:hypothetical protein
LVANRADLAGGFGRRREQKLLRMKVEVGEILLSPAESLEIAESKPEPIELLTGPLQSSVRICPQVCITSKQTA